MPHVVPVVPFSPGVGEGKVAVDQLPKKEFPIHKVPAVNFFAKRNLGKEKDNEPLNMDWLSSF